jgi:predicted  nucleic acid-binding Zn-ribbon protein
MIEQMLKLQQLNMEIDHIRSDAQVFPDKLSEVQKIYDTKKKKFDDSKNKLQAVKAELGDFQNTLSLEEQRLIKSRKKLNELDKAYEYQAMKKEIDSTEKSNQELNQKITAKAAEVEKFQADFTKVEEDFKVAESNLNAIKAEAEVKTSEFTGVLNQKLEEAKQLEAQCDKSILSKYNMIRTRKYQDALVAVTLGACQGCFMNIPPQMANQMQRSKLIVETCPNCQRLIFWNEAAQ